MFNNILVHDNYIGVLHVKDLQRDVQLCNVKISDLSSKLQQQDNDIYSIKEELKKLLAELKEAKVTLKDIAEKL